METAKEAKAKAQPEDAEAYMEMEAVAEPKGVTVPAGIDGGGVGERVTADAEAVAVEWWH